MRKTRIILLIFIVLGTAWFISRPSEQQPVHTQLFTFGTIINMTIWTSDSDRAATLLQQMGRQLNEYHKNWYSYHEGELSRLNHQIAQNQPAKISSQLSKLLLESRILAQQSEHLFNPAIGALSDLWGFNQLEQEDIKLIPPSDHDIDQLVRQQHKISNLSIQNLTVSSERSNLMLNVGAFAKGYAVDRLIEQLQKHGFNHALINAGGDIKAIGSKGDKQWHIAIRNPQYKTQTQFPVLAAISLNDNESIVTSGNYERSFQYQSRTYHHILDPQSGYPADGIESVTVLHHSAAIADAAATALFIAAAQQLDHLGDTDTRWRQIADNMGIKDVMIIDSRHNIFVSASLYHRIDFPYQQLMQSYHVIKLD